MLSRLGLIDQVLALGSPRLAQTYTYVDGKADPHVSPPKEPGDAGYSLSVRREPLLHILLQHAISHASVECSPRTRFLDTIVEGNRVVGARLATTTGERKVRARIVVGADGRHSAVARAVAAADETSDPPIRGLFHRYVKRFPGPRDGVPDGAEFSLLDDELAYVFPSDDGVTCVALSVGLAAFAEMRRAPETRFRERLERHLGIAGRFAASIPEGKQLGCGPEPSWVRVPVGLGWALVGDAGLHQDPWTGRGMDTASTHAVFLFEALLEWFQGRATETQALAQYHSRRNAHGLPMYRETLSGGRDLRLSA